MKKTKIKELAYAGLMIDLPGAAYSAMDGRYCTAMRFYDIADNDWCIILYLSP